jgi:hypothetical protein
MLETEVLGGNLTSEVTRWEVVGVIYDAYTFTVRLSL